MTRALALVVLVACGSAPPPLRLTEDWPSQTSDYDAITATWTRKTVLRGQYQEVLDLAATFKSPDWRAAHAERDADYRGLTGDARAARIAQARADMAGPYEIELMVTTWDRKENDLDRGKRSVWHVALVDDQGNEIAPLEIVRDKRPAFTVRAEFPALGDFATAYIARFPHTAPVLGPNVRELRLRMSSERGGVEVAWKP
ncbi:MAG TPA: hypothetical protein VLX92_02845 [Kofleriaceae bacterium]|nr:hypothetical protein [Kofleriaceae bacterium]